MKSPTVKLDRIDRKILEALQADARVALLAAGQAVRE
jgi:DNA-binding Lrp family transcriptional regulator